jgi:hypothetical protein
MKLDQLYRFIRKLLFEVLLYFVLQSLLLIVLAVVIVLYPYALNLMVSLFFVIMAAIGLYVAIRIGILFHKVKKVKDIVM